MDKNVMELLRQFLEQTRAGNVKWEFLADDDMIRATLGRRLVRIGHETEIPHASDGSKLPPVTVYPVWIIGPNGRLTDEFTVTPLDPPNYELVANLDQEARKVARDSRVVLQELIDALDAN